MSNTPEPRPRLIPPGEAGFGLVSVLVAIVLLTVGALSVSNVLTQSMAMQTIMNTRTTALDVARAYMEEIKSRDPADIAAEDAVQVNEQGEQDETGVFTRQVLVENVDRNIKQITVVVTSPRSNPIELVTLVYDQTM